MKTAVRIANHEMTLEFSLFIIGVTNEISRLRLYFAIKFLASLLRSEASIRKLPAVSTAGHSHPSPRDCTANPKKDSDTNPANQRELSRQKSVPSGMKPAWGKS
jgi:hypothetical protein